jgi:predicted site-specific integrase-resolvase
MEQTITATDFANRLNVSVNQVYRWADAGLIPGAVTASGTLRIPAAARRPYVSRSRR